MYTVQKSEKRIGKGGYAHILLRLAYTFLGLVSAFLLTGCAIRTSDHDRTENVALASETVSQQGTELTVHYLDVGQGDCTLLICDGEAMLIDAGENEKGTTVQLYLMKQGIEKLKYLVLTHPDSDHIGGADVLITKYDCDTILMPELEKDSKSYRDVIEAMQYKGIQSTAPVVGTQYTLGSAVFTILAPVKEDYGELANNYSIALLLQHGENRFLFVGDAETEAEQDMLDNAAKNAANENLSLQAEVYKVGHHGSYNANGWDFLKAVSPQYAVISCGADNPYGYPHSETLNYFRKLGTQVYRTDEQGTIVVTSDGKQLNWNTISSETWQAAESTQSSIYYVGNRKNGTLHLSTCTSLPKEANQILFETKNEAEAAGFTHLCSICRP